MPKSPSKRSLPQTSRWLDAFGFVVWTYILVKVFVADIDRLAVEAVAPSAGSIVNYRWLGYLGALAVVAATFRRRWLAYMYVLLFPVVLIGWKVPRYFYRRRSWGAARLRVGILRELVPLPAGSTFPEARLSECVDFLDHQRRPINESERSRRIRGKSKSTLYPYYGANGQAGWIDGYLFDEPLVLLAEDGGAFGSPTRPIAYRIDGRTWVNNHAHVLRPLAHMDVDYLCHALAIRPDIADVISGSTRGKLNREVAGVISVSVPPLPEQRRIAAELRVRLAEIDAITTAIDAEIEAIEALPAALLRRAFDDLAA